MSLNSELLKYSGQPYNILDIALPGLLALFPLGLFQEADLGTVLFYSLVKDVVAVTPIVIKAVELIQFGNKEYFGAHTQYHRTLEDDSITVAQFYPAKCYFNPLVPRLGFILLGFGLGLMIVGIVLEALVIRALRQKKYEWNSDPDRSPTKELHGLLWYASQKDSKEK